MLMGFVTWWLARMTELFPRLARDGSSTFPDAIVLESNQANDVTALLRRNGQEQPITLDAAARMAARKTILLRPPATAVLEKRHVVPTASRRDLQQLLHHELSRITPFSADALFWRWDSRVQRLDRTRTDVSLTLVPKMALTATLDKLATLGIQPRFLTVGPPERPRLLPLQQTDAANSGGRQFVRVLAATTAGFAVIALILPFLLQAFALHSINNTIDDLQPAVAQAENLRRALTAGGAGNQVLVQERQRTGDVLQVLAAITRILPDDTFLTDFSLRNRHLTLGGRSASAPRLITGLSADPAIRSAAFAAPVTRIEGATMEVFSIQGEIAP